MDSYICGHTEKKMEEEFIDNEWIEGGTENIYKFPKNNVVKISFQDTASAKRATKVYWDFT